MVPLVRNVAPDLMSHPESHSAEALRRKSYINALGTYQGKLPNNKTLNRLLPELAKKLEDKKGRLRQSQSDDGMQNTKTIASWL